MEDNKRVEDIRRGWVTNYPNPEFTGDKIECLCSIDQAQKDIAFLLDRIDSLDEKGKSPNTIPEIEQAIETLHSVIPGDWEKGYIDCRQGIEHILELAKKGELPRIKEK